MKLSKLEGKGIRIDHFGVFESNTMTAYKLTISIQGMGEYVLIINLLSLTNEILYQGLEISKDVTDISSLPYFTPNNEDRESLQYLVLMLKNDKGFTHSSESIKELSKLDKYLNR
ncbi:MAG: hypothetical protein KAH32_08145 [Chlamydiia bacterium]|nr:hypothetical protein [Chlamydiia bacterium]